MAAIFLIGGVTFIILTFVFLFLCRELGKLLWFLIKRTWEAAKANPRPALVVLLVLVLFFGGLAMYHEAVSDYKPKREKVAETEEVLRPKEREKVEEIIKPKGKTRARKRAKTLSDVKRDWVGLYERSLAFRKLSNKMYRKLGIEGYNLFASLDYHESGGKGFQIGDTSLTYNAYGRLQCRQMVLNDFKDRLGIIYTLDDLVGNDDMAMLNSAKAFDLYTSLYLKPDETGSLNAYLNTWHEGPPGTSANTAYSDAVRANLKKIEENK
jgi:hypothetical protein